MPSKIKDDGIIRWIGNLFFGLTNRFMLPIATLPVVFFATNHAFFHKPVFFSGAAGVVAAVLILDFTSYLFHVISHKVPFFWRFHEIHHLDCAFDTTTGLRIHFGELLFAIFFRSIPIMIFAISLKSVVIFEFILILDGLFHHTNILIPKKINNFFGFLIVTPDMHSVHHHAYQPDTDSNYGFIFNIWDKIFKTYNVRKRSEKWRIGLEYSSDLSFVELLISPFMLQNLKDRSEKNGNNVFYKAEAEKYV